MLEKKVELGIAGLAIILIAIALFYALGGKTGIQLPADLSGTEPKEGYSKAYVDIVENEKSLVVEVMPDSTPPLKASKFAIILNPGENTTAIVQNMQQETEQEMEIVQNKIEISQVIAQDVLQANLDEESKATLTVFEYRVLFQNPVDVNSIEIEMENAETGEILPKDYAYVTIAKTASDYSRLQNQSKEEFLESHPELKFEEEKNRLHLIEGEYEIKENTIIPKNLEIVIDSGTKIKIGPGKSIVFYSSVEIQGTEEKPVEITGLDENKSFGVVGVIGNGKDSKATIKHLKISGGSEHFINGIFFSGQLSIYHADLELSDSTISGSSSDDGLNAKYGSVLIQETEFSKNYGDQADLDFCTGTIKGSVFQTKSENANGDGLDVSGSKILVKESIFEGFKDKGISIGEKSTVFVYNNKIENNNMGSAVKDLSEAFFIKNDFKNNNVAIAAYQKKQVFGGADFFIYENLFEGNDDKTDVDEKLGYKDISFSSEEWQTFERMANSEDIAGLEGLLKAKGE